MVKKTTKEFKFELKENLAILTTTPKGWTKEFDIVSWDDHAPVYDVRTWAPDHKKMTHGVSFSVDELKILRDAINKILDTQ